MVIVGVDPGFASMGIALLELEGGAIKGLKVKVLQTAPAAKKRKMLVVDDLLQRVRELWAGLSDFVWTHEPKVMVLEAFSQPQHSNAATRLALGYAVAVLVAESRDIALIQFLPGEIRKRIGVIKPEKVKVPKEATKAEKTKARALNAAATKKSVYDAVARIMPSVEAVIAAVPKDLREHAVDAAAVALAAVDTDIVRAAGGG